jgi:CRP-like cAMP-binding protein
MAAHRHSEHLTFPTGARLFQRGQPADAIYGIRRGLVDVIDENGIAVLFRQGELISYQDIIWRDGRYRTKAVARTPVEVLRLDRLSFLNLLHFHPTLAVKLLGQQHDRLREQRANGTLCY